MEKFLHSTIDSALKQSYNGDYEILVIDDGSEDDTPNIADFYGKKHSRIRVMNHQTNLGVSTTRNDLLDCSKGEIIVGLDGDDILHPNSLEKVVKEFEKFPEANFVYTDHGEIDEYGGLISTKKKQEVNQYFNDLILHCHFPGHLRSFRKTALSEKRFDPSLNSSEDYDFLLNVFMDDWPNIKVRHIPETLYFYRMNPQGISQTTKSSTKKVIEKHLKRNKLYDGRYFYVVPIEEGGFRFWDHKVEGVKKMDSRSKEALLRFLKQT